MKKPMVLIIIDGFGIAPSGRESENRNAIASADTKNLDMIFKTNPYVLLDASGEAVGLPKGQMGNSEVGHMNIGAGRIVYQDFTRINNAIKDGTFFENKVLNHAIDNALKKRSGLHLMGLLSSGGVHSHIEHLYALMSLVKKKGMSRVYIHAFLDGRDTPPNSGISFVKDCTGKLKEDGVGEIATICGRFYAMDRDNRWDRIKKAYELLTIGKGEEYADPISALSDFYKKDITDEFMEPILINKDGVIKDNDGVIFFNFRPDRARELTAAFTEKNFGGFKRQPRLENLYFATMTQYDKNFNEVYAAFPESRLDNTLGEVISKNGLNQLRVAETEKYAHVTFFFNAGKESPYLNEDRVLIPSPKVTTYDLKPEMSAKKITEKTIESIKSEKYDMIVLNFANCDMVGHTGNFEATVRAVEVVDECVGEIVAEVEEKRGVVIITADHGNAEKMLDENNVIFTAHTANKVPFCVVGYDCKLKGEGSLSGVAPTILEILGIKKPSEMTAESLIAQNGTRRAKCKG